MLKTKQLERQKRKHIKKTLKKYKRKERKRMLELFNGYEEGKILKIEGKKDGEILQKV